MEPAVRTGTSRSRCEFAQRLLGWPLSHALLTLMAAAVEGLNVGSMALTASPPTDGHRLLTLQSSRPQFGRKGSRECCPAVPAALVGPTPEPVADRSVGGRVQTLLAMSTTAALIFDRALPAVHSDRGLPTPLRLISCYSGSPGRRPAATIERPATLLVPPRIAA